jgi:PAS domain S-box-containing protein
MGGERTVGRLEKQFHPGKRMTILIVDGDVGSRKLLARILATEGYQVNTAGGEERALASLAAQPPDLILLDIQMPGADGLELCRKIKASDATRNVPVILLSASAGLPERVEGFRVGAVDYVAKPFQREELLARVRTHLELGRLRANLEHEAAARTADLRESEERFRAMADAAPVMIWACGPDKQCTFVNKGWLDFTARTEDEEMGNGWASGVHPDDAQRVQAAVDAAFEEPSNFELEYRLRRGDGEYRWILDRGAPRFSGGDFAGYVGSAVDITDLTQNHERLLAAQKLESLGIMAAGVAHDFGNILGSIFGEADLALSEMEAGTPGRENVEKINRLASYATEIVSLLTASAGGGVNAQSLETVNLSSLVEQMLRLMAVSISKRASVRCSLAKDLPAVSANGAQIRQLVMNLIANASEALGGKQGAITITTSLAQLAPGEVGGPWSPPAGDYIRLTVQDTGCGMSAETRARIFDQFFTTKSPGRGLGLAAVHGIVRSHGGAIKVVSAPGAGSTFEILLPCVARSNTVMRAAG